MKTKFIYITSSIIAFIGMSSCNDFDSLNENPNAQYGNSESIMAGTLRYGASLDFVNSGNNMAGAAHLHERIHNINWDHYSQYMNPSNGWSPKNYIPVDGYNSDYWDGAYQWLRDVNQVIYTEENSVNSNNNIIQIARIWRVFIESRITDYFGHVPFPKTDYLSMKNLDTELAYRNQSEIYNEFFSELTHAVSKINVSIPTLIKADLYYSGDMEKWVRFANTLHLRLALRISEIDASKAQEEATKALNRGIMQSGDDMQLPATAGWGNQYNYVMYQVSWGENMLMTKSMENILNGLGGIPYSGSAKTHPDIVDPRGAKMFDPSISSNAFAGIVPGLPSEEHTQDVKNQYSRLGVAVVGTANLKNDYRKLDVMLYEEACFLKAEAYERWKLGDAKSAYEEGITESFKKWNLADKASEYIASADKNINGTSVAYNDQSGSGNTALEKIITQKYIAGFPDGSLEAWNDKRRLNLPNMLVPKFRDQGVYSTADLDPLKSANFIKRMKYPSIEQSINENFYTNGINLYENKTDAVNSNMWWDKNANYNTSTYKYNY